MPILILLNPKVRISFTSTTQSSRPNVDILTSRKQFKKIEPYYKQKHKRKNVQGNKRKKMEKQPNKRNK
jgi:hypothetical protein